MKFCTKCGNELMDEAVICTKCGCMIAPAEKAHPIAPAINAEPVAETTKSTTVAEPKIITVFSFIYHCLAAITLFFMGLSVATAYVSSSISSGYYSGYYISSYFYLDEGCSIPAAIVSILAFGISTAKFIITMIKARDLKSVLSATVSLLTSILLSVVAFCFSFS